MCDRPDEVFVKRVWIGRDGWIAVSAAGDTPAGMQSPVLIAARVDLRGNRPCDIGRNIGDRWNKPCGLLGEERGVIGQFFGGQLIIAPSNDRGVVGTLGRAPAPVGLVFAGAAIGQGVLDLLDLVVGAKVGGQTQIAPDTVQQCLFSTFVADFCGVGINQIAGHNCHRDSAASDNLVDTQVARLFGHMDLAICRGFQAVGCVGPCFNPQWQHGCTDVACRFKRQRSCGDQAAAVAGKDRPLRNQRCIVAAVHGDNIKVDIAQNLPDINIAARCSDVHIGIRHLRLIHGKRREFGADPLTRSQIDDLAADIGAGNDIFAQSGRDRPVGADRGRTIVVLQWANNGNNRIAADDVDIALRIAKELHINRIVGPDRVVVDRGFAKDAGELVGRGCLAVPGCRRGVVGLVDARVFVSRDFVFVNIRVGQRRRVCIQVEVVRVRDQRVGQHVGPVWRREAGIRKQEVERPQRVVDDGPPLFGLGGHTNCPAITLPDERRIGQGRSQSCARNNLGADSIAFDQFDLVVVVDPVDGIDVL